MNSKTRNSSVDFDAEKADLAKMDVLDGKLADNADAALVDFTEAEERRLVWKLDAILMPFSVTIYLLAYLDRGNLGNARLIGLQKDALDGSDAAYSLALTCFFITYIVFCVPGTLAAKVMSPSHSLALGCFIWSAAAACMAATNSPAGVYVCRLLIGLGEAFFGQALPLWCSFWYTKRELAKRVGFFICFATLAGAFGGLIAFGVAHINSSALAQWRCLFLIEGLPGVALAIITWLFLPTYPQARNRVFSERERSILIARKARESTNEVNTGVDWKAVRYAFLDWRVYGTGLVCFCINVNISSVTGFLPSIIKLMGYTAARAQLFTVPPYAVALVVCMGASFASDRLQSRGNFLMGIFALGAVGWGLLLGLDPASHAPNILGGRYFGCICLVSAAFTGIPLSTSWVASNNPAESQRAVGLGMITTVGQLGSILGSNIFPSKEAPHFTKGCAINIAFQVFGIVLSLILSVWWRRQNASRDQKEGGRPTDFSGIDVVNQYDRAPGFRYVP